LEVVAGAGVVGAAVSGPGVAAWVAGGADNQEGTKTKDKLCIQVRRVSWRAVHLQNLPQSMSMQLVPQS
jgi:hypothetical protein